MTNLHRRTVTVAGAGVMGLVVALRLARAGAQVRLCDPAVVGDNASGVAAGMLAPAFESVLDAASTDHFPLLAAARDLWPALLASMGAESLLDRSGALLAAFADQAGALAGAEGRMLALGLSPEPLNKARLQALQPALSAEVAGGLYTAEDWRLSPMAALSALSAAARDAGVRRSAGALAVRGGRLHLDGEPLEGAVVIAAGAEAADLATAAPELGHLVPIKGQILHFDAGPFAGPVVRSFDGYVVPQGEGALAGASMEAGRRDREPDAAVLAALRAHAARLFPHLASAPARPMAGVRAASPDGLPLVGRSSAGEELLLCVGARRNGWLLAPLAAETVLRTLAGHDPGAFGAALDPQRFG